VRDTGFSRGVMRPSLFWDVAGCGVIVGYRRCGVCYRSHLQRSINPRRTALFLDCLIIEDATYHGPKRRFPTTHLPRVTFKNSEGLKFQRNGRLRDARYSITVGLSIHWLAKWFDIDDGKKWTQTFPHGAIQHLPPLCLLVLVPTVCQLCSVSTPWYTRWLLLFRKGICAIQAGWESRRPTWIIPSRP
jgi:hypothetical protein